MCPADLPALLTGGVYGYWPPSLSIQCFSSFMSLANSTWPLHIKECLDIWRPNTFEGLFTVPLVGLTQNYSGIWAKVLNVVAKIPTTITGLLSVVSEHNFPTSAVQLSPTGHLTSCILIDWEVWQTSQSTMSFIIWYGVLSIITWYLCYFTMQWFVQMLICKSGSLRASHFFNMNKMSVNILYTCV